MPAESGPRDGESLVAVARLRAVGDEGWLNAWSGHLRLSEKAVAAFVQDRDIEAIGGERAARAVCSRDGWVAPRRAGEKGTTGQAVLEASVFSREPRDVVLRASASGKMLVLIGDEQLTVEEMPGREGRALPDERFFDVHLGAGKTDITVILESEASGFYLRLREKDGRPVRGLLHAERFAGAACDAAALVDPGARLVVGPSGLTLETAPRVRGLIPALDAAVPFQIGVMPAPSAPPAIAAAPRAELLAGIVERSIPIPVGEKGSFAVELTLGGKALHSARLPAYGALVSRVAKLVEVAARVEGSTQVPSGSRSSFAHHVATLSAAIGRAEPDVAWVRRQTEIAEALAKKLDAGKDAYAEERGVVYRAYRSPLDDKLQPYVAFVPKSYDKKRSMPLVLVSHGKDRLPEHALRTLVGEARDEHMTLAFAAHNLPAMRDLGAIYAAPWGYGNGGARPVGEQDVLAVIRDMNEAYRIDDRRIGLTGYSLGGTVSFVLPLHFPDVFSAAAPLCGYPNLLSYQSVARAPHLPWEYVLLEKEYIVRYAENGIHVPLHIVHGGKDGPGRSKVVADRYQELGYPHVFDVQDDLDHNVWDYAYEDAKMVPWLTRHAKPKVPKQVRLVTGRLRYDRSHWLRLVTMIDSSSGEPASLDGTYEEKEGRLRITTKNVAAFEVLTERLGDDRPARLEIVADGTTLEADTTKDIGLARGAGGVFALADVAAAASSKKHHGLSGPLDDAEHGPVTIVYGSADPAMAEANRMVAEHLSTLGGSVDIAYPVLRDDAATDAELAGRNVVLIGSPAQNVLTRTIASMLPVTFEPGAITLRGERHEGADLAVSLIFPGPETFTKEGASRRSERYVVVHAGTTPRAALAVRFLPRYLPDYVVYDAGLAIKRGGLLMDGRPVKAAGFFDESWR